jgi:hypothetical protein
MSPQLIAMLQGIARDTRRVAGYGPDSMGARYPRDYYRPAELVRQWRGVAGSRFYPSVDGLGPGGR